MIPKIIFEDESLIILDKPTGWVVNESETTKRQKVVQKWLKKKAYPLAKRRQLRSGIVHRLDKETSGVLVIAKTEEAFKNLQAQFKARKVDKTYTALVHGKVEPERETVKAPIGRLPWNRERFGVIPGGRQAETAYQVKNYYKKDRKEFTILELRPKTGRTHQIRVHLKHLSYPIVSDEFYAGRKTARSDRVWCPRLFLHATEISFTHPKTSRVVKFKSELPKDLQRCLKDLKK